MVTVIIIQLIVVILLAISMVRGIDKHQTEYPDYTGDDFLELDGEPFQYNKDELNEFEEWNATLEDGSETEPWWGDNNDNPDTTTTGKTNTSETTGKTTTITDETGN
jgi:hypothetical protein